MYYITVGMVVVRIIKIVNKTMLKNFVCGRDIRGNEKYIMYNLLIEYF